MNRPTGLSSAAVTVVFPDAAANCEPCTRGTTFDVMGHGEGWRAGVIETDCAYHLTWVLEMTGRDGALLPVLVLRDDEHAEDRLTLGPIAAAIGAAADKQVEPPTWLRPLLGRVAALAGGAPQVGGEVLMFAEAGFDDPGLMARAQEQGVGGTDALSWMAYLDSSPTNPGPRLSPTPAECVAWMCADGGRVPLIDAEQWMRIGSRLPEQRAGLDLKDGWVLFRAGVPFGPGWAGAAAACPTLLRAGADRGHDPCDVVALATALMPHVEDLFADPCIHPKGWLCPGSHAGTQAALAAMEDVFGLDLGAVALCLRAGMSPGEAGGYVRGGGDMDRVRLLAALA